MAVYFRLKALIEQKEAVENRRITYRDIASEAGVSTSTLTKMSAQKMDQVGLVTINKLCAYFKCQVGDLLIYIPDKAAQ